MKKRLIALVALALVIAATAVATSSAAIKDNGGLCFVRGGQAHCGG